MTLYEEHTQFARNVIRVVDACIHDEFKKYNSFATGNIKKISYSNSCNEYLYKEDYFLNLNCNTGVINAYSYDCFTFNKNSKQMLVDKMYDVNNVNYTEEMHFQDSLVYDSDVLLGLVLTNEFNLSLKKLDFYKHCTIYFKHINELVNVLDWK